ncbi:MAG: substrate-binding domain-containing protein [Hyphomicrobium sp.]
MRDKLLAGEPADLMILSDTLIEELARSGHVVTASIKDVSRVAASIAVRAGDPLPPIATADDLRAGHRRGRRDPPSPIPPRPPPASTSAM